MKYFLMLIFCFVLYMAEGQPCRSVFSGKVLDFHDGTPLVDATIYIESLFKYASTDSYGQFSFEHVCDGELTVVVSHLECDALRLVVLINGDTYQEINLEHHIEELSEVIVEGRAYNTLTKTSQETLLKTKSIERYSAFSLGDALKQISGVNTINTGNTITKPIINGLHSSRVVIMTNNVRLQDQEWGIEHAPNIDINTAGSVHVVKGANALAYGGDAIGGVIVLKPSRMSLKDSLYGKTIISGQSNGRGYSINTSLTKTYKKGWYIDTQASAKRFGDFNAPDYSLTNTGLNSKGMSINTGFKTFEKGFNAYYSYLNNKIAILRSSHLGNIEDLNNAIKNPKPSIIKPFGYDINAPKQEVTHQIIKTSFYKRYKRFGRLEVQYHFQNNHRFEYDKRVGEDRDKPAIDLRLKTHTIKSNLKIDSKKQVVYEFGMLTSFQNNFANPDTGVKRLIPDYDKYDIGAYMTSNVKLKHHVTIDFGIRYDFNRIEAKKFYSTSRWIERGYDDDFGDLIIEDFNTQLLVNPVFDFHNLSASTGIAYKLDENHRFVFNYGLSNRAPNPSELFSDGLHHSAARIELGDLRIKQETSNRVSGTYHYDGESFSTRIEGFYNHINDYIFIEPTGVEQTIRGAFPVWRYNQTRAVLFGIDITSKYLLDNQWSFIHKSSFIKGRDLNRKQGLIDIPSFKTVHIINYENKKWLRFNAELQSDWVFKQNDFPNNNFEIFMPTTLEWTEVDVSSTPPAYHLVHFQSGITLNLSKKTNLNIGLNITNIFNTSYRENLNRLRLIADDLGRNFLLQLKLNY